MSSFLILLFIFVYLSDVIAHVLLRSIEQVHHLLLRQPHVLTLEPHIHPSDSVIVLVNQESLIPVHQFAILFLCHIFYNVFILFFILELLNFLNLEP